MCSVQQLDELTSARPREDRANGRARRFGWSALERVVVLGLCAAIVVLAVLVPWGRHARLPREEVVVRPGDTLIGIVEHAYPGTNPYPILYRVERETDGGLIWPGERLTLPGPGGQ